MRFLPVLAALSLAACSPTFNWREVRVDAAQLRAMLPCKPDKASRTVPMAGRDVELQVLGCDTGGATFALLTGDIVDPLRSGEVLRQWKTATLANMRSASSREQPFVPAGAMALPQSLSVVAVGQGPDGSPVESHAAYFARGSRVVQAVIYSGQLPAEAAETFFSSLKFE